MPKQIMTSEGITLLEERRLAAYTTFQLGGPAVGVIGCATPQELRHAVQTLHGQECPFILIGGGSNLVVSDQGLDCYVIRYLSPSPLIEFSDNRVRVSGSTLLDNLVECLAEKGWTGLNYASGIPGTVGGAVVGNAGAFGQQVGDVLESVCLIDQGGNERSASAEELEFEYRSSVLKKTREMILEAVFYVTPGDVAQLQKKRAEILQIRAEKHPDLAQDPCAGSFFRNIKPTSQAGRRQAAGWFLDQAGGKALSYGGAGIYHKHANIIVKRSDCHAQDVFELSRRMANLAKERFDLDLVREVRFVGDFEDQPTHTGKWIW